MKHWKRLCAMVLTCALALSFLPAQAGAYSTGTVGQRTTLSLGGYYSATIKADDSLWMWGENWYGQLGDGTHTERTTPLKIMDHVASVSLGGFHSAAIKTDGSLWMWGDNRYGQLGDGTCTERTTPVKIMDHVASVNLGSFHSAAIKTDGSLWMWGWNEYGQLGDGTQTDRAAPLKIMDHVTSVSLGLYHSAAVKTDGSLWMWGDNGFGQLGDGTLTERATPVKIMDHVASVCLGNGNSAAIKTDGSLWMWGDNRFEKLGDGTHTERAAPVKIMDHVTSVSLGRHHSAAVKTDGSLWMWGWNGRGQLGDGTLTDCATPVKIMDHVASVCLGYDHSAAIKTDGSLWMWGLNSNGQLGLGKDYGVLDKDRNERYVPTPTKLGNFTAAVPEASKPVSNTPSSWAEKEVNEAISIGLVPEALRNAYTASITRAEFCSLATALYESFMHRTITERATFSDTSDVNVQKMAGLGVVNGVGNGRFAPDSNLTRQQAATILARLAEVMRRPLTDGSVTFADKGSISSWAYTAVGQVQASGIMNGVGDNKFSPAGSYTREQSILTILRLLRFVEKAPEQFEITLSLDGGDGEKVIFCCKGNRILPPDNPAKDGFYFGGWFKDKACTKAWNFDKDTVSANLTLYAKWIPKTTVTDIAEVSNELVQIDGKEVKLSTYTLLDAQGTKVNFVKLRDIAYLLDGTAAQFNVDWRENAIRVEPNSPYTTRNGAEMTIPTVISAPTGTCITPVLTNGVNVPLEAFHVVDKDGGGNNYFKLKDIAKVANFNMEWDANRSCIIIATTKDYKD